MKHILLLVCLCVFTTTISIAQETDLNIENQSIIIEAKDYANTDVYIDGKKYGPEILELLDQSKIITTKVIKNETAKVLYDTDNTVILITTKKADTQANKQLSNKMPGVTIRSTPNSVRTVQGHSFSGNGYHSSGKYNLNKPTALEPLILIDGDTATNAELQNMNPDMIKSISVKKDQKAIKEHNSPAGVIIVETKN